MSAVMKTIVRYAVRDNIRPALPAGQAVWPRLRRVVLHEALSDHRGVICEGDESGKIEGENDTLSTFRIDEARGDDAFSVDDLGPEINVTIGPDFNFIHAQPLRVDDSHDTVTQAGGGSTASGDGGAA